MDNRYREYYWKRLDNAAKSFSSISDAKNTNVFRISVSLTFPVEQDILQQAVERTLADIPSFNIKQRKGLFWYYFESNFARPVITEDHEFPCLRIERGPNNGFLFRITYFHCKINLEVFHSLTDGTGALLFLSRLLYHYLSIHFPDEKFSEADLFDAATHPNEYEEDSFCKNYSSESGKQGHTSRPAMRIWGIPLEKNVTRVIVGIMPSQQVISLAKGEGATVTEYLTAVLLYAIYCGSSPNRRAQRPIVVCIPVNLRAIYRSHTLSNFFSYLNIGHHFKKDIPFSELLGLVRASFERELQREQIEKKLRYNVEAERNPAVRFIPLFIKRVGLKWIHSRGERGQSCALSNLGVVRLPKDMAAYVERYDVLLSISSIKPIKTGVASFGDKLSFSFTSSIISTDIQQYFFSFLSEKGVDIEIVSNQI